MTQKANGVNNEGKLFTAAEVAERLRVTPAAIYRWIGEGKIDAVPLGRRRMVPYAEVARLESGRVIPADAAAPPPPDEMETWAAILSTLQRMAAEIGAALAARSRRAEIDRYVQDVVSQK